VKFIEPAFDAAGELWPRLSEATSSNICALKGTIANQSAELYQRLTEVLELYNAQQQQANELAIAYAKIDRLARTILVLQEANAQHEIDATAAQNRITLLESENAALLAQHDRALQDSRALADQLLAMETAFNARETNVVSALEQVEFLNSELATAAAEQFKLVATVHGEKRRQRSVLTQQTSILQDKIKRTEALAATQEMQIRHLEAVRTKLDKRIQVLETLLRSDREIAELKIKRMTEELRRARPDHLVAEVPQP
jgi:chromosome segregation ATPase